MDMTNGLMARHHSLDCFHSSSTRTYTVLTLIFTPNLYSANGMQLLSST